MSVETAITAGADLGVSACMYRSAFYRQCAFNVAVERILLTRYRRNVQRFASKPTCFVSARSEEPSPQIE
ncbi:hypothetical protein KCP78_24465 [Salmonella enterica subsp. enterica]|nr:hypothetical protein KCP78_24465 [Salmonella enterica subsp. enterica]